jgi:hypothetical protein
MTGYRWRPRCWPDAEVRQSKHRLFSWLALVGLALMPCHASASSAFAGKIHQISVEQGKAFFHTNGERNAVPACGGQLPTRWVINAAIPDGQAMLSFLLTLFACGKPVIVVGTGASTDWGDTETVRYIMDTSTPCSVPVIQ